MNSLAIKAKLEEKIKLQKDLLDKIANGTATEEETAQASQLDKEIDGLENSYQLAVKAEKREAENKTPVNDPLFAQPKAADTGIRVFKNFAEQLKAVKNASNGVIDDRLVKLNKEFQNASGMNEGIGTEGGFAVQTDFAGLMMDSAAKAGNILPLVDRYEVSAGSNSVKWVEVDESDVSTTVFGGVRVYWASEAAAVTASKAALVEKELKLEKLMGLAYATYELDADSNFISQLYSRSFALGIQRTLEGAIVSGDGKGKPSGIINSGSKVTVAKEAGQAAATILWDNLSKMYNRAINKDQISSYIWLANPDTAEQFDFMQFPVGTGGVPVYLTAAAAGSVATLKGRPIVETDHCSALGTEGDLIFTNLADYMLITKGGVQADTSIHVQFLAAENAFRFIFRANGMPKRNKTLTIKNSSNARSSIITLATR
jgi:HK97 family phage major capsid protein